MDHTQIYFKKARITDSKPCRCLGKEDNSFYVADTVHINQQRLFVRFHGANAYDICVLLLCVFVAALCVLLLIHCCVDAITASCLVSVTCVLLQILLAITCCCCCGTLLPRVCFSLI
jgi:hypothetical protein